MNIKEKAKTIVETTHYLRCYSEFDKELIARIMTEFAEAALNSAQSEIQQLKEQLKDVTAVEVKLGELQAKVEAAKTILNRYNEPKEVKDLTIDDDAYYVLQKLTKLFSEGFSAEKSSLSLKYQKEESK